MTKTRQYLWVAAAACVVILGFLMALTLRFEQEARSFAAEAARRHPGGQWEALIAVMEDVNLPLRERNRAGWALGHLGDARALDAVRSHVTGQRCDHEARLCQDLLRTAVRKLEGDWLINPPWRWARAR